uniref:Uncharacterized protein n=1 Tax=Anguilla anguilla TaxID=7936 RepID=A0A0E9WC50_ANGAN
MRDSAKVSIKPVEQTCPMGELLYFSSTVLHAPPAPYLTLED